MVAFLMMGQSNMAGRGFLKDVPPLDNENLFVLRNGRWVPLWEPANPDRPFSGVGPAPSFARAYADAHPGEQVGLIPCADGGTSLAEDWYPGSLLYDHALAQAKLAMRTADLAGILWHQGESDCRKDRADRYLSRLETLLEQFCADLGKKDLPVLIGGLGEYLKDNTSPEEYNNFECINRQLKLACSRHDTWVYVDAKGLGCNPDVLHLSAASQREFGKRYFEQWKQLEENH